MISRHRQLDLDEVTPGMILSDTLFDGHDDVLLPNGTTLTEAILTSLRRRGIDKVFVLNDQISDAELAAENERIHQRLVRLFRRCGSQGASKLLLHSIRQYRLGAPS